MDYRHVRMYVYVCVHMSETAYSVSMYVCISTYVHVPYIQCVYVCMYVYVRTCAIYTYVCNISS